MLDGLFKLKRLMTSALNTVLIVAVLLLVTSVVWGVLTRSIGTMVVSISESTGWEPWSWIPAGQAKWTEELARFLLVWVSLLGGAVAFGIKGHLGVDYFVGKFDPEVRRLMALFAYLVVLFFAVAVFVCGGVRVVSNAFAMEQMTPALGLKMGYIYLALPISGLFMVLFTIESFLETWVASPEALYGRDGVGEVE